MHSHLCSLHHPEIELSPFYRGRIWGLELFTCPRKYNLWVHGLELVASTEGSNPCVSIEWRGAWAHLIVKASISIMLNFIPYMPAHYFLMESRKIKSKSNQNYHNVKTEKDTSGLICWVQSLFLECVYLVILTHSWKYAVITSIWRAGRRAL